MPLSLAAAMVYASNGCPPRQRTFLSRTRLDPERAGTSATIELVIPPPARAPARHAIRRPIDPDAKAQAPSAIGGAPREILRHAARHDAGLICRDRGDDEQERAEPPVSPEGRKLDDAERRLDRQRAERPNDP